MFTEAKLERHVIGRRILMLTSKDFINCIMFAYVIQKVCYAYVDYRRDVYFEQYDNGNKFTNLSRKHILCIGTSAKHTNTAITILANRAIRLASRPCLSSESGFVAIGPATY